MSNFIKAIVTACLVLATTVLFGLGCATSGEVTVEDNARDEIVTPPFKITSNTKEPIIGPDGQGTYQYWLIYELENGAWGRVLIRKHPLTDDIIKEAVAEDIARRAKLSR